jgi:hypothetical protein
VEDLPGRREGGVPSYLPFLLILLVAFASLPVVHVVPSSYDYAERALAPSSKSPLGHIGGQELAVSSNGNRTYSLGALHEKIPDKSRVAARALAKGLPTHFDWRDYAGQNWMTSVRDQGGCGSCVAFGAVAAVEGQFKIQANNPAWGIDLSEAHLFSCGGGLCSYGWWVSSALDYLQANGTPDEACSPYRGWDVPCTSSCSDWRSRAYKISSWNWVATDPSSIETALQSGPLVATFDVYTDFFSYTGGIYYHTWGGLEGGHAVAIVGYDSIQQYWTAKNSWGPSWGDGGYFKIGFGQVGIEQEVASVRASIVTATTTVALPQTSISYAYGTTTKTSTSYTSTSTLTSTIPTVTTVVLVPLTTTSVVQSIQYLTSILTMTVTSYTGTRTSTSEIPTVTTVALVPLGMTAIVQSIQYLTSILTTTVTSHTGTETSTSTVVVPTTVVLLPSTATSTIESIQYLTSTSTTTVTNYTNTSTSTGTSVVYTTVTVSQGGAGADASSPLAYLGFMSVLAIMASHGVTAGRSWRRLQDRHLANITKAI